MPLHPLERQIFFWLHGFNLPVINQLMVLASGLLPWLPILAWLSWVLWRKLSHADFWRLLFLTFLLRALVDTSTSYFFKNLIQRLRPCKMAELKSLIAQFGQGCGGRWGFFSSHAANASALIHFLNFFLPPKKWLHGLLWGFVLLVSYSRIYLGVHLPLDVVVGILWGTLLASGWRWIARSALRAPGAL